MTFTSLYFRNLPGITSEKQAEAVQLTTEKSIAPFLNYYHNYRRAETAKVIKIDLELYDWSELFEKFNLNKTEKKLEAKIVDDLSKIPRELKEIRLLKSYAINDLGIYKISIDDDKQDDDRILADLKTNPKVSFVRSLKNESFFELIHVSTKYEIVVMKKQIRDKKILKRFSVYHKPDARQINLLINTLEKIRNTPASHNRPIIRLFENRQYVQFPQTVKGVVRDDEWLFLTDTSRSGNDKQREFVRIAMETPDFAILEGPPGSGKTTTILELIYQLVKRDQRVLLVGSTHVAVDNVIEKLMDPDFPHRKKLDDLFLPIRIGNPERHPISDFAADYTFYDLWSTKRREQVQDLRQQSTLTPAQQEFEQLLVDNEDHLRIRSSVLKSNAITCGTTFGITSHQNIVESDRNNKNKELFDFMILDEASKTTFQEFLIPGIYAKKFVVIGDVKQLSPFVDENGLSSNIGDLSAFPPVNRYWKTVLNNFHHLHGQPKRALIICDYDELDVAYNIFVSSKYFTVTLGREYNQKFLFSDVILTTKQNLIAHYRYLPSCLGFVLDATKSEGSDSRDATFKNIETSHILPTLYRYKLRHMLDHGFVRGRNNRRQDDSWEEALSWRIIRLNEVSHSTSNYRKDLEKAISQLLPLDLQLRRAIEADFSEMYQITLPSILQLLQIGLQVPMFRPRSNISTTLSDGLPGHFLVDRFVSLEYQHRMHPEISEFARIHFYNNQALKDSNKLNRSLPNYNLYSHRMIWIDVVHPNQPDPTANEIEIKQIKHELKNVLGYLKNQSQRSWEIGILTFYKKQRRELFSAFDRDKNYTRLKSRTYQHKDLDHVTIRIDVVDSYQGHEADFVFLSMVRNFGVGFMDNPNRLNVALTRAKYQLVIVGNNHNFKKQEQRSEYLAALTQITTERGLNYEN